MSKRLAKLDGAFYLEPIEWGHPYGTDLRD